MHQPYRPYVLDGLKFTLFIGVLKTGLTKNLMLWWHYSFTTKSHGGGCTAVLSRIHTAIFTACIV